MVFLFFSIICRYKFLKDWPNQLDMNSRFLQISLVFSMLITTYQAEGQSSRVPAGVAKYKYFQIPGRIKMEKGDPSGAVVNLFNLDSKQIEKSVVIPSSGKFDLELSFFKEYRISVTKNGYYDKELNVSTVIPLDVWEKDSIFPPFYIVVTLYKKVPDATLSFEGKTIGKVSYSPNGTLDNFDSNVFIDDQAIQDEIYTALKNIDDKDFNQKMAEALEYEKKNDLSTAYSLYSEASKIKPSDKFVKEKLKELAYELKNLGNEAKIQAEYDRLIALGDANVNSLKYNDAIQYYKGALKVRPNDPFAVSKLAEAEKQLALAGDKARKDAEFNRLMAEGDASVSQTKYAEALTFYKDALKFKINEFVNAKITETERLMQIAEKEHVRLEMGIQAIALKQQKYKEAIDKADQLFASKNYTEAKLFYHQALAVDQVATYPDERIREIDKIVAQLLTDALSREQESTEIKLYNEAVKIADESFKAKNWNLALANYTKASDIRPNEPYPKNKIQEVKNFITQENVNSKLYTDAMNSGATNFSAKQYPDAISAYREAQKIKPSEILPSQKIKEIQSIIDALAAKTPDDQKSATNQKLSSDEKSYLEKITIADENFKKSQWSVARFYYIEASKFKQGDNYSLERVDACDNMIDSGITAEKMQEYKNIIYKADDEMKAKNYSSARFYYRSASDILKWETYPQQQLKEIDRIVAEKLSESDQRLFTENLNKADDAFNRKEYAVARFYYNKAIKISQSDHVASRLKEIESIVNGPESQKINAAYDDFIKKGDEAVKQKNSSIARFYFQKAIALKPNENYPKEELKKIDSGAVNP